MAALAAFLVIAPSSIAEASENDSFVVIPVLVNGLKGPVSSHKNSAIKQLKPVVDAANVILNKHKIHLHWDAKNSTKVGIGFSGFVSDSRWKKLRREGLQELKDRFEGGVGYKIYFTDRIFGDQKKNGVSFHPGAKVTKLEPVAFVRIRGDRAKILTGNDLAHEVAHSLSLGEFHKYGPGANQKADSTAHVFTHGAGEKSQENLLYPWNQPSKPRGTKLTTEQVAEVMRGARRFARKKKQGAAPPGGNDPPMYVPEDIRGSWTDELEDAAFEEIDLHSGTFFGPEEGDALLVALTVAGLFPSDQEVDILFELGIDADADASTGQTLGQLAGVELVLQISLSGHYPFTSPDGSLQSQLVDLAAGTTVALSGGVIDRDVAILEFDAPPDAEDAFDASTSIEQAVPLADLGELAPTVPFVVRASDWNTGAVDEALENFDTVPPVFPLLEMTPRSGARGQSLQLSGSGFEANSEITLLAGDLEIGTALTDSAGNFEANATIPQTARGTICFVIARDAAGSFDFSVFTLSAHLPFDPRWLFVLIPALLAAGASQAGSRMHRKKKPRIR